MTTLQARSPYTEAELQRLYPPTLRLQLVQILLRHGERTPVNARFQHTGLPAFWPYCSAVRQLKSAVLLGSGAETGTYNTLEWKRRLETFGPEDAPVIATGPGGELDDVCDMGSLTDRGRETTFALGTRLRSLYVDRLGFLPQSIPNADFLYLRSTPVPRALESLHQAFSGLYPPSFRSPNFPPPTILTRAPADETLFPNDSLCRRFAALSRAFAQRTADRWNNSPEMDYLNTKLSAYMSPESPRVAVDSRPRLSGIMDTINATRAHGAETRLPKEFYDQKLIEIIERIGMEEWYSGYRESREYRTLGIGALMADVVARMVGSVERSTADGDYELMRESGEHRTPIRFGMSGCHDTTLGAVLSSLGALGTEHWPPFTSHIAVELFREAGMAATAEDAAEPIVKAAAAKTSAVGWLASFFPNSAKAGVPPPGIGRKPTETLSQREKKKLEGYYVRLRYNDEPVAIPGCKLAGNHLEGDESFCTLVSIFISFTPSLIPYLVATHALSQNQKQLPPVSTTPPRADNSITQAAFKAIVDKYTPTNWREQCRVVSNAPPFAGKPEPAGY
jgi:acid phosphatase